MHVHYFQKADGKLTSRYADAEDEEEPQKKKRKTIQRIQRPTLAAQFKATDTSDVAQVSDKTTKNNVVQNCLFHLK